MSYDEMGLTLSLWKVFINIPQYNGDIMGLIITMLKMPWKFPRLEEFPTRHFSQDFTSW